MIEDTKIIRSAKNADTNLLTQEILRGESVNTVGISGIDLAMYLTIYATINKLTYLDYLMYHKIDVNHTNVLGQTALHLACIKTDLELVKELLKRGYDPNIIDNEGNNPLMSTCSGTFMNFPITLKSLKLPLSDVTEFEKIAYSYNKDKSIKEKMFEDQLTIIDLLIRYGTDLEHVSNHGHTALDLALFNYKFKDTRMVEMLNSANVPMNHSFDKKSSGFKDFINNGIFGTINNMQVNDVLQKKLKAIR